VTLLLDTNIVLRLSAEPETLPVKLLDELSDRSNDLFFSAISLWEIVIKAAQDRPDFQADADAIRQGLLGEGLTELSFTPDNAIDIGNLPRIHDDPFDRALVAQARAHKLTLLTSDKILRGYPAEVRLVKFRSGLKP
jgi:PIN domain nuclease of toxin-antitoxin system